MKAAFALAALAAAGPAGALAGRGLLQSGSCEDVALAFYCRSVTTFGLCSFNTPWCLESCGACPGLRVQSASEEVPPLNPDEVFKASACWDGCCDVAPPASAYSCEQQAAWGKCGEPWMDGFCFASCGRCTSSEDAAANGTAQPLELAPVAKNATATNMTAEPVEEEAMPMPVPEPEKADAPDNATAVANVTAPTEGPLKGVAVLEGAEFLGCFRDQVGVGRGLPNGARRDLTGSQTVSDSMTPALCMETCVAEGFAFFGVQGAAGDMCFCGNSYGLRGKVPNTGPSGLGLRSRGDERKCSVPCAGDPAFVCGESFRNLIWAIKGQEELL